MTPAQVIAGLTPKMPAWLAHVAEHGPFVEVKGWSRVPFLCRQRGLVEWLVITEDGTAISRQDWHDNFREYWDAGVRPKLFGQVLTPLGLSIRQALLQEERS